MSEAAHYERCPIEWGFAGSALERESGDVHVVTPLKNGVLVAVIDGLGHGPEAASAAQAAGEIIRAHAGESVLSLVQRCHESLRRTRGAVMSLASFDTNDSSVTWVGVGNVEGLLLHTHKTASSRDAIMLRGGVVGYQLPPLRADVVPVSPGDTLIMATDGIRSGFTAAFGSDRSPQDNAETILAKYARSSDDALVVVVRYLGP